jgi:DEAD/DEAH box helicase
VDVVATSARLGATYRRYLRSLLPVREPALAAALRHAIESSPLLTKGPILETSPPYQTGASLRELIADGVLDPAFAGLGGPALPLDRPLYLHQEQAIRKAAAGRNLVVATGTGSGKTECFLLPVLSELIAEHSAGTLGPGVRALLLYPMNALANDQVRRLRQVLERFPHITFGRYTGDTPERAGEGASLFAQLNPGQARLPGELLSRQEMRDGPPHLLLTNYAMLEYLLLRPADIDLFEGKHSGHWRFIVLDEAHVYDGAKAEEVGMLLRRLRERVGRGSLQAIATSATVGDRPQAVMDFAAKLFDAPFEWSDGDPARQDLVRSARMAVPDGPFWGPLSAAEYLRLAAADDPAAALGLLAPGGTNLPGADAVTILGREQALGHLRKLLAAAPRAFGELAATVFPSAFRRRAVGLAPPAAVRRRACHAQFRAAARAATARSRRGVRGCGRHRSRRADGPGRPVRPRPVHDRLRPVGDPGLDPGRRPLRPSALARPAHRQRAAAGLGRRRADRGRIR